MCGSNSQQAKITDAQQQMYTTLNQNYATTFGQDQAITSALTSAFQPILAAGPSQQGYSPAEMTNLNTQSAESIAQNYAAAQRATAGQLAAIGGGNTLTPSSVASNILAQNTTAAAYQRSQAQQTNLQASYNQGYSNWQQAAGVLGNTAQLINPLGYASTATGAGSAASTSAYQMAMAANSPWNAAIGALGAVGGAALGGGLSSLGSSVPFKSLATSPYYNPVSTVPSSSYNMLPTLPTTGSVPFASAGGY